MLSHRPGSLGLLGILVQQNVEGQKFLTAILSYRVAWSTIFSMKLPESSILHAILSSITVSPSETSDDVAVGKCAREQSTWKASTYYCQFLQIYVRYLSETIKAARGSMVAGPVISWATVAYFSLWRRNSPSMEYFSRITRNEKYRLVWMMIQSETDGQRSTQRMRTHWKKEKQQQQKKMEIYNQIPVPLNFFPLGTGAYEFSLILLLKFSCCFWILFLKMCCGFRAF